MKTTTIQWNIIKKLLKKNDEKKKVFRIKPPMCITKENADFTLNVFEDSLSKLNK